VERWRSQTGDYRICKSNHKKSSADYVLPEERIATFNQDGTLWVEHPMYTQVMYILESVPEYRKY
jgi:hypothetical protein